MCPNRYKSMKKIYIGSDHGGFRLKEQLKKYFDQKHLSYVDVGPSRYTPTDDYPDVSRRLAMAVAKNRGLGILICRNGIGVSIVANKIKGIRAVSTTEASIAKTARADDDTNVLCLGQDFTSLAQAKKVITIWLKTPFSGSARHRRRLRKVAALER